MIALTPTQVRHIAKLARLTLTAEEEQRFAVELTGILGYIEKLGEVETKGVEPTASVTGLSNVLREDALRRAPLATPESLLATSPLPIVAHQIQTPSAHG